jgi:prolipoprotein diacylglyceryl transferase
MICSIPSPGSNALHIGPVSLNAYGLMIALGVLAAVWLCGRRFEQRGVAKREVAGKIAIWAVAAGVVGSRLYHVATDWERFEGHWFDVVKIWQGGLGIPGGMLAGVVTGVIVAKHYGIRPADAVTCAAPALPLAQAIGRWGNWFNQELYGKPTSLPWGLKIDEAHRGAYIQYTTFHPTFLYEFIWDIVGVVVLLLVDRYFRIKRPALFALYVSWYCFGRFFEELLRIDPAHEYFGLRLNAYVSIVVFVLSTGFFIWWQFIRRDSPADRPRAKKIVPEGPAMAVPKGRVRSGR